MALNSTYFPCRLCDERVNQRRLRVDFDNYLKTSTRREANGCIVLKGKAEKKEYAKFWVRDCKKTFNAHFVSLHISPSKRQQHTDQIRINGFPKTNVSHLCHNKRCMNHDHLVAESKSLNASRNKCSKTKPKKCICEAFAEGSPKCFTSSSEVT